MAVTQGTLLRTGLSLAVGASLVGGLAGCRGERSDNPPRQFFPDMDDPPRFEAQYETDFFADGRTQRQPVEGTIAYARWPGDVSDPDFQSADWSARILEERARLIREDRELYFGSVGDDPAAADFWSGSIPVEVTREMILSGQEQFNIYCAACHGYEGNGLGMVGQRWSYPVPSFHDDKYQPEAGEGPDAVKTGRDGYLYHIARNGVPDETNPGYYKMPPYKHALDEQEAWAVVAYMRALQRTKRGSLEDVPEQMRQRLNEMRGLPTASAPRDGEPISMGDTP